MSVRVCPEAATPTVTRSPADRVMRRFLFLPEDAPPATKAEAQSAFQRSILISATRCVLMYLVFPFVLPALGIAKGVGPVIGLVINALAMVAIYYSMRRFWRADHPKRWWYFVLGVSVWVFLIVLAVRDVSTLVNG